MLRGPCYSRIFPDIYVAADDLVAMSHRVWCEAATLLLPPGGAVGGLSAAWLWGVDLLPLTAPPPVSVVIPHGRRLRGTPYLAIVHAVLPADDVTTLAGVPVTTPARTAFDLGRQRNKADAVIALDAMLHRRLITKRRVEELIGVRRGLRGVPALRCALAFADHRTESPMESRVRLLLHDAGLPAPVPQHRIFAGRRFLARVDFAYPGERLVIEYEGDHHRERHVFRFDVARLNDLHAAGWRVIRLTADDVLRSPAETARRIEATLRSTIRLTA
ncbi:type IV toxin-antitoxin system AbiEi family antitoxin [Catenuloplanes japonicus]|uniref:type IV toxin-antitoxin system AbiEi family antitoxin n=1 Tax=Catenuloplanes japonicus TaxID=33876 RepID=UPI0018DE7CBA|nr:DUF559 domain-containing protein [Catenuloplanes japonicus]